MGLYRGSGGTSIRSRLRLGSGGGAVTSHVRRRPSTTTYAPEPLGAGGWVTGITISPDGNTRLARTDTLGAWRWDVGTDQWVASVTAATMPSPDDQLDSGLGVQAIVASNTVAFMGYRSSIYKSTDGGRTWVVSLANGPATGPNTNDQRWWNSHMVIDSADSNICIYGTFSSGVWYTLNGGTTWAQVPSDAVPFGTAGWGIPCVTIDSVGNWYAGVHGAGIYRSTDHGTTWTLHNSTMVVTTCLAAAPAPATPIVIPIARVTTQDVMTIASANSVTATYPSTPTQNNLLIAVAYANVGLGNTAIPGWTLRKEGVCGNTSIDGTVSIFEKVAGASEPRGVTATSTGATITRIQIYEYSGAATTSEADTTGSTANSGATTVTSQAAAATGQLATTNANDMLIAAWGWPSGTSGWSVDSSFTLRLQTARMVSADRIVSAAGTYHPTLTWTGAQKSGGVIAAFKASGGTITDGDVMASGHTSTSLTTATTIVQRLRSGAWSTVTPTGVARLWRSIAYDPTTPGRVLMQSGDGGYERLSLDYADTWAAPSHSTGSAGDVTWLAAATGFGADFFFITVGGLRFDPIVAGRVWMSQGVGVWYADLPAASTDLIPWHAQSRGIEQLVVNDIIAPPSGPPVSASWDRPLFVIGETT